MSESDVIASFDEGVDLVHRAFCDPDHELVGEWDRSMAAALRRRGYRIVQNWPEGWLALHSGHHIRYIEAEYEPAALVCDDDCGREPDHFAFDIALESSS